MVLIMRQADTTAPSGDEAFHSCYNLRNLKIPEEEHIRNGRMTPEVGFVPRGRFVPEGWASTGTQ